MRSSPSAKSAVPLVILLTLTPVLAFAQSQGEVAAPAQTFTSLFSFNSADGASPQGSLVQAADGNLYGTTTLGGLNNNNFCIEGCGTIFRITPNGKLTTIYNFCSQSNCPDGYWPQGALILSTDGNLYGVTQNGGVGTQCNSESVVGCGTVFKLTLSGKLTTLHSFDFSDGDNPYTALVRGSDSNFYGVTGYGGVEDCIEGCGTVFKITPEGSFTTLHLFQYTDGALPGGALIQGSDGNLYGTTLFGGANGSCDFGEGCGTVYKITTSGQFTTLYNFETTGGYRPSAALLQVPDGNFWYNGLRWRHIAAVRRFGIRLWNRIRNDAQWRPDDATYLRFYGRRRSVWCAGSGRGWRLLWHNLRGRC